MRTLRDRVAVVAGAGLVTSLLASAALAQPCTPGWNYAIGNPAAADGYVGSLWKYNNQIIASGSFTSVAGVPNTSYIASYSPSTNAWSAVGNGLGSGISNAFGTSFATYGNDLIVGGFFANASGVADTKSLARWDGTAFHSMGPGWAFDSVNAVWSLLTSDAIGGQNRVYIGGGFETIAGQPAGSVAMWDGTALTPIATSMTLDGINPIVPALAMFDDGQGGGTQLYIGGRFATVNGVSARMIARWNGTTWSAVGTNLAPRFATAEIDALYVFDDGTGPALYAGGTNLRINADGVNRSAVKWNGTTWTAVGQPIGGRTWSFASFDDGSGTKLYAGGTQAGVGFIYRLEGNTWVAVDGGASAQVVRLFVDGDTLYAGGSFTTVAGQPTSRIIARRRCDAGPDCNYDYNQDENVDLTDAQLMAQVAAGLITADPTWLDGDLNLDENSDLTDAQILAQYVASGVCPL